MQNLAKVCSLGNLANTVEKAASKQLVPFLLVDQALDMWKNFGYLKGRLVHLKVLLKNGQNESIYDCKNYFSLAKYKSEFYIHQEVPLTFNFM